MGVSRYDNETTQRRLEAMYVLTTAEGVEKLLGMFDKITLMPYDRGDYGVVDLIIDMYIAISVADLTQKQRDAIYWVLMQGYTQAEYAGMEGITQQVVQRRIATACEKIAGVFRRWQAKGAY